MRKSVELITKIMKEKNVNQSELAQMTGKVPTTLSKQLGKGAVKRDMTFDVFYQYVKALGYEVALIDKETNKIFPASSSINISEVSDEPIGIRITIETDSIERIINL